MITSKNFSEYIDFLRKNFNNVIEYRERTGTLEPSVIQIGDDLFDEDPFVVFNASIAAAAVLYDRTLYH
jgi:trehalose-6-phosphatase